LDKLRKIKKQWLCKRN